MKWWGSRLISSARTKRSSRSARENCCDSITCRRRVVTATKKSPSPALWPRLKGELGRVYRKLVARMAKRPGHVEVVTEVGFCNFCNRTRNLRNEEYHLGGLVRTIVTCETCHRTLSSTMGVAETSTEAQATAVSPAASEDAPAPEKPAAAKDSAKDSDKKPVKKAARKAPAKRAASTAKAEPAAKARAAAKRTTTRKK